MNYTKGEWYPECMGSEGYWICSHSENARTARERLGHIATLHGSFEEQKANAHKMAAAPRLYEELKEVDAVICILCKRLNPQHVTMDNGKGCNWCPDREIRLKALALAEGKEVKP